MITEEKWKIIRFLAEALGVKKSTVYQWRNRNAVPAAWHIPLITASNGFLAVEDFIVADETTEK